MSKSSYQLLRVLRKFIALGIISGALMGGGVTGFRTFRARSEAAQKALPVELPPAMTRFNQEYSTLIEEMEKRGVSFTKPKRREMTYPHPAEIELHIPRMANGNPHSYVQLRELLPPDVIRKMGKLIEEYEQFAPELERVVTHEKISKKGVTARELKRGLPFTGKAALIGGAAGAVAGAAGLGIGALRNRRKRRR